jgi:hypothetical protein
MPCGCKKHTITPAQQPAKIIIVENGQVKAKDPAPSPIVPPQDVNKIVDKLNEILSPQ